MKTSGTTRYPDGLGPNNAGERPARRLLNWITLLFLAGILLVALSGVLGGGPHPVSSADSPAAQLKIKTPSVIRSGMFFEMAIEARARRPIPKPVLAVPESYWRDITINTSEPQAARETSEDRMFLFEYEPMKPGDVLRVKFDGQINPSLVGSTRGTIELRDDKSPLAQVPLKLRVLP